MAFLHRFPYTWFCFGLNFYVYGLGLVNLFYQKKYLKKKFSGKNDITRYFWNLTMHFRQQKRKGFNKHFGNTYRNLEHLTLSTPTVFKSKKHVELKISISFLLSIQCFFLQLILIEYSKMSTMIFRTLSIKTAWKKMLEYEAKVSYIRSRETNFLHFVTLQVAMDL